MSETENTNKLSRRTPFIEFSRQLLPQPPKDAEPYFCLINTLIFYKKDTHEEVWRRLIPEADWLGFETQEHDNKLEHRHGQHNIRVEYEEGYGWVLKFTIAHDAAKAIWKVLFPQVNFKRKLNGQKQSEREAGT